MKKRINWQRRWRHWNLSEEPRYFFTKTACAKDWLSKTFIKVHTTLQCQSTSLPPSLSTLDLVSNMHRKLDSEGLVFYPEFRLLSGLVLILILQGATMRVAWKQGRFCDFTYVINTMNPCNIPYCEQSNHFWHPWRKAETETKMYLFSQCAHLQSNTFI